MGNDIKVVYIDGPTGSGKDYLMDQMVKHFTDKGLRVKTFRSADYCAVDNAANEARKYVVHDIDNERLATIYRGHRHLVTIIRSVISRKEADIVIVNRSILTMLAVNLWEEENEQLAADYVEDYGSFIGVMHNSFEQLHITVDIPVFSDEEAASVLEERIIARQDGKTIDPEWFKTLVTSYRKRRDLLNGCFTYNTSVSSDQLDYILTKYF